MSEPRPVVGTAEAMAGLLRAVSDALELLGPVTARTQWNPEDEVAACEVCGMELDEDGDGCRANCARVVAEQAVEAIASALHAWRERGPLRSDEHLSYDVAKAIGTEDQQETWELAWRILDAIDAALLGSPVPQGGRRG